MNISNLIKMMVVDKEGYFTPEAELFFGQNNTQLQKHLSNEGYVFPSMASNSVTNKFDGLDNSANGTVLFDTRTKKLRLFVDGTWETITSA